MTTFASLGLSSRTLKTLAHEGYKTPTPVQARCIPVALDGRDVLGCAQTGTGKTAAFLLPMIERLAPTERYGDRGNARPRALILAPTRELAGQIEDGIRTYGRGTRARAVVIYGGVKQHRQVRQLRAGAEIIVATPGRLLDLMNQGLVDLRSIETFVLDEADRMLDMGFIDPIRRVAKALPAPRQTLFFSATMPPKIRALADAMLRDPVSVTIEPEPASMPKIEQSLYHIAVEHKPTLLKHLLEEGSVQRGVVFTKTKHGADKLAKSLERSGVTAGAIHGNRTQKQRERTLNAFRDGRFRVLVATDVAARGLDVDGVTDVFNYNLPMEPEAYVHRIGRTGRAGATGRAVSFCSREERGLLRGIERFTEERIDATPVPEELGIEQLKVDRPREQRPAGEGRKKKFTKRSGTPGAPNAQKPKRKKNARRSNATPKGKRPGGGASGPRGSARGRRNAKASGRA